MKMTILCDTSLQHLLPEIREELDDIFVETRALLIGPDWSFRNLPDLQATLAYGHHCLIAAPADRAENPWASFSLGYYRNDPDRIGLLLDTDRESLPVWTRAYRTFRTPGELPAYLEEIRGVWGEAMSHRMARRFSRSSGRGTDFSQGCTSKRVTHRMSVMPGASLS